MYDGYIIIYSQNTRPRLEVLPWIPRRYFLSQTKPDLLISKVYVTRKKKTHF